MNDKEQVNLVELARGVTGLTVEVREMGRRIGGIENHIRASDVEADALRIEVVAAKVQREAVDGERARVDAKHDRKWKRIIGAVAIAATIIGAVGSRLVG